MKFQNLYRSTEKGQGLVEYALILVLVAVVVIAVLLNLGPVVGDVFSKINRVLTGGLSGVITQVTAARPSPSAGSVKVTITVAADTTITLSDPNLGGTPAFACSGSCQYTIPTANSGTVTVTDSEGGLASASYPAKN